MSKAVSKPAFEIATTSPQDDARSGVIAGVEFNARPFTMREMSILMGPEGRGLGRIEDEAEALAPILAKRCLTDGVNVTPDWLMDNLTRREFQAVIEFYMGMGGDGDEGKA